MSLAAMNWARRQKTGSASRKAVLMAIADYADEHGLAWPSQRRIADDTELTDRTVRTAIGELMAAGFLVRRSKRDPITGQRDTDRLQLLMGDDQRKEFPHGGQRKQLPLAEPPENDNKTTGNSRQNHRKFTSKPPEAFSAEPTIEPPENPQLNRSDANASGGGAAGPVFSDVDDCWVNGKLNLQACGQTEKQAGSFIGSLLKRGIPHRAIAAATRAAAAAGTREPIEYVNGCLRAEKARGSPSAGRRSSMVAIAIADYGPLQ